MDICRLVHTRGGKTGREGVHVCGGQNPKSSSIPIAAERGRKGEKKRKSMAAAGGENSGAGEGEFYLRYYVGHKGKFGHEFLEFEFRPDGKLRYANNSNYKNDTMIRKEVFVSPSVLREARRIIQESDVCGRSHFLFFPLFIHSFIRDWVLGLSRKPS
jgi:hypothetical protein